MATDSKVDDLLDTWAQGKAVIRAEHFFWIMGDPVQKSREGLLRHFLHSALSSLPSGAEGLEMSKHVCGPKRLSNSQRAWAYAELYDMLVRLASSPNVKFVFLIDALDECEPQDRLGELAGEVVKISQLPNVKLCVSCRPWSPFVRSFQQARILHLDKLTYHDMELYVSNRLADAGAENDVCEEFRNSDEESKAARFAADVASASEGVFLWTELVVKALTSELCKGGGFGRLEKTLLDFPVGLDEYFQELIFNRITKTRQNSSDTAAALMLALKIAEDPVHAVRRIPYPDSFINFWLLRSGYLKLGFSWIDHEDKWMFPEDARRMVRQTRDFLEETCKELLLLVERFKYPGEQSELSWDVQFLHRTVSDFLRDDRVKLIIEQQAPDLINEDDFLERLGKLRCMYSSREMTRSCVEAEELFCGTLLWSQPSSPDDRVWIRKLQALAIERHWEACLCLGDGHETIFESRCVSVCASTGLTEYLFEITASWPYIVVAKMEHDISSDLVSGWLEFAANEPHVIPSNPPLGGVRTIASSWSRVIPMGHEYTTTQDLLSSLPIKPSVSTTTTQPHMTLLNQILRCGLNPNQQKPMNLMHCRLSIWQRCLASLYRQLKKHDQDADSREESMRHNSPSERIKREVSDIIVVLLQHGANPDCTICVSDHALESECKPVLMENVLASITPRETIDRLHALRAMCSVRFDAYTVRRKYMLRAMASFTAVKRKVYTRTEGAGTLKALSISDFLYAFFQNDESRFCSVCRRWDRETGYAVAVCLDCDGRYYLCQSCPLRRFPTGVTDDDLSRRVAHQHERPPSVDRHTLFLFGIYRAVMLDNKYVGELSVLEDWYARNTNGQDAALD